MPRQMVLEMSSLKKRLVFLGQKLKKFGIRQELAFEHRHTPQAQDSGGGETAIPGKRFNLSVLEGTVDSATPRRARFLSLRYTRSFPGLSWPSPLSPSPASL